MTTATMVLDPVRPLQIDENMKEKLARELAAIGLVATGMRGNALVIRVHDRSALPQGSFRQALRQALDSVPEFWDLFESATFN